MFVFLVSLHILVCIWLIVIVLLQAGKGSGLSGLFGGGSAPEAIFGGGGDNALKKITTFSAVVFLITSTLLYVYVARQGSTSVVRPVAATSTPATQGTTPAASIPTAQTPASQPPTAAKTVAVPAAPVKSAPAAPTAQPVPAPAVQPAASTPAPAPAAVPAQPITPAGK